MATKTRKERKEIRGDRLKDIVRKKLPNVGYVKLHSSRRKVTFKWRSKPFVATSRLMVSELGLFGDYDETDESRMLTKRLRSK